MLCLRCVNVLEPIRQEAEKIASAAEVDVLLSIAEDAKRFYSVVKLCKARKAVVVGNPGIPTQSITTCDAFVDKGG